MYDDIYRKCREALGFADKEADKEADQEAEKVVEKTPK
jgi:hypothetical protein